MDENEKPEVSLSEEESKLFQRILRASRRDIKNVEIDDKNVRIKCFMLDLEVDLEKAMGMSDEEWRSFFIQNQPPI